jgi:uncharacterized protein YbjT (DUF2867 family)
MDIKVIITGATGLVGEGVLIECLKNADVKEVLMVNRKPYGRKHDKLKEIIVPDFFKLDAVKEELKGYNACFYCAGISSRGMLEVEYAYITYDTTIYFADQLDRLNRNMTFCFVSGSHTDSSEHGPIMWARVKGKTEIALAKMKFKHQFNFRPGFMKPSEGQKNIKGYYKVISFLYPVLHALFPGQSNTIQQLGRAMINSVTKGYPKQTLEIKDIKLLAKE